MVSILVGIIYNSIQSGHPWQTPHIRVEESDRRPSWICLNKQIYKGPRKWNLNIICQKIWENRKMLQQDCCLTHLTYQLNLEW